MAETGTGMGGGAACYARVFMGQSPRLRRVHHAHAAVFSHSTEVRPLRTTRTQCKLKRRYCEETEPSLESPLFVTLPYRILGPRVAAQRLNGCQSERDKRLPLARGEGPCRWLAEYTS